MDNNKIHSNKVFLDKILKISHRYLVILQLNNQIKHNLLLLVLITIHKVNNKQVVYLEIQYSLTILYRHPQVYLVIKILSHLLVYLEDCSVI